MLPAKCKINNFDIQKLTPKTQTNISAKLKICNIPVHFYMYVAVCRFSVNSRSFIFQVKAQYVLCKRLRVPVLTYPESMKVALEMGPEFLRGFARYSP